MNICISVCICWFSWDKLVLVQRRKYDLRWIATWRLLYRRSASTQDSCHVTVPYLGWLRTANKLLWPRHAFHILSLVFSPGVATCTISDDLIWIYIVPLLRVMLGVPHNKYSWEEVTYIQRYHNAGGVLPIRHNNDTMNRHCIYVPQRPQDRLQWNEYFDASLVHPPFLAISRHLGPSSSQSQGSKQ